MQASLLAQECWHQVCSPDRQLHCSGVFNMPGQDPSALEALKKLHQKMTGKLYQLDSLWWQVRETLINHQFEFVHGGLRGQK